MYGSARIPGEGRRVRFTTIGLPGGKDIDLHCSFSIDLRGGAIVVHVPGHNRGPDNCEPHCSAQEEWLDGLHSLMRRSWGCQWSLHDRDSLKSFMEMLWPMVESYEVVL